MPRPDAASASYRTVWLERVADAEWREWITKWVRLPDGLSGPGKEMATTAIREALAPFHVAVAQLQAQAQAEQQRIQERANRQAILTTLHWALPWGSAGALTPAAVAAVTEALDQVPVGATPDQFTQARDLALKPHLAAHEQRQRKAQLIAGALPEIYPHLVRLERNWDFEGKTAWTLAQEFTAPIRERLESELTGEEPPDQVLKLVRRLVRAQLDVEPDRVLTH